MVDKKKIEILDKAFDRLKDFETLMDNFESRFSKFGQNFVTMPKRPYLPIYNEKADYNTNAQSYYDYLARINRYLHEIEIVINIILERLEHLEDIETKQTLSITPTQIGKLKDISELVNNVNISLGTVNYEIHGIKKEVSNGTLVADWGLGSEKSGLFSKDLTPYLEDIYIKIDIINDNLNRLDNVDVGNHLSLSSDKNKLILTRKNLKGDVLESDVIDINLGDIDDIIFSVINFDYEIIEKSLDMRLFKGQITNSGFVDIRIELTANKDIPLGIYKVAKINEVKAQATGSKINGIVQSSGDYQIYGGAMVVDEYIYMNTDKIISKGSVIHFCFAYRNFLASPTWTKGKDNND